MGQRRRWLSEVSLNALTLDFCRNGTLNRCSNVSTNMLWMLFQVIVLVEYYQFQCMLTAGDFSQSHQAFWIRCKEARKHNRQCQPPVCWAGPRSARLRHRQLRLQNDEAVKPQTSEWQRPFCLFRQDSMMSFFSVSCRFVSVSLLSFFLSALLVCLDFGLFWKSLYLKGLMWIWWS